VGKITVRRAQHEDVAIITDIIRKLGWFPHVENESPSATEMRVLLHLELADADDSHTVLVATDEEEGVAGYISVHWLPYLMLAGPEGYVSELFVREDSRGKGVGTILMNDVKELAIAKGCSRLMLLNRRDSTSSESEFYEHLGFEERPEIANLILPLKKA
jgi:ribosomal protein S18 acetylase RimI-like enzyme